MTEQILDKKAVIAQLVRSPHGNLEGYGPVGSVAARQDPEFFGHLISWNHHKGQIRDSKVALPVLALAAPLALPVQDRVVIIENALAHLADLTPMMLQQAMEFARRAQAPSRLLRRLVTRYLRDLEADSREWERVAVRHREVLRTLYGRCHIVPGGSGRGLSWEVIKATPGMEAHAYGMDRKLMARRPEGKFAVVRSLRDLPAAAVLATLQKAKLPFLTVRGALGERCKEPDIMLALMQAMTPTEFVTSVKLLKRLGVMEHAATRAAFEAAIAKAGSKPKRGARNTLKTTRAAATLEQAGDEQLATKMRALQEKQLDHLKTIEGDWLMLIDMSHSMAHSIELGRQLTGILARTIKGKVHVVFFNTEPRYLDATGMTYEALTSATGMIRAQGGTCIGVGLDYILARKLVVDGICIVSDGGHNAGRHPEFSASYKKYAKALNVEPTVYFYQVPGDPDYLSSEMQRESLRMETFDLRKGGVHAKVDFYSLPDLVQTMRVARYELLDEIYDAPFRKLDEVLTRTVGQEVLGGRIAVEA